MPDPSDDPSDYWRSPIFEVDQGPKSTNLRTLCFYQSEIDPQALTKILSFPRYLQHFTLTHHDFLTGRQSEIRRGVEMAVRALTQQQGSLESLELRGLTPHSTGIGLSRFSRLQTVDMDFASLFGNLVGVRDTTTAMGRPNLGYNLHSLLPVTLQQLFLRYRLMDGPVILHRLEALKSLFSCTPALLPNLKQVHLIEKKLKDESPTFSREFRNAVDWRLDAVLKQLKLNGVDSMQWIGSC